MYKQIIKKIFQHDFIDNYGMRIDIKHGKYYENKLLQQSAKLSKIFIFSLHTNKSLKKIDQIIQQINQMSFIDPLTKANMVVGIGYYLGETIIKEFGGFWNDISVPFKLKVIDCHPPFIVQLKNMYFNPFIDAVNIFENNQSTYTWLDKITHEINSQNNVKIYKIGILTKDQSDQLVDFIFDLGCNEFNFSYPLYNKNSPAFHKSEELIAIIDKFIYEQKNLFNQETKKILKNQISTGLLPNVFKRENFLENFIFFRKEKIVFEVVSHDETGRLYLTDKELENFKNLGIEYTPFVFNRKKPTVRKKKWYEGILKISGQPMR